MAKRTKRNQKSQSPCQLQKILLIHVFAAQNTRLPGRNSMWFKFTASEDKPHAPAVGFSSSFPRKRESTRLLHKLICIGARNVSVQGVFRTLTGSAQVHSQ